MKSCFVLLYKSCNCPVVRGYCVYKPHQFQISFCFNLQASAGSDLVQIAVNMQFQQIGAPIRCLAFMLSVIYRKSQLYQIQRIHIGINYTNGVVLINQIV